MKLFSILFFLFLNNSFAQMTPISVSAEGEAIPMNATQDDKDVAKAKAELANSMIEGDESVAVATDDEETEDKKSKDKKKEATETQKEEIKKVAASKADDVLMEISKEEKADLKKDGQIKNKVVIKKLTVEKNESKTIKIFSDNFLERKRAFQISYGLQFTKWSEVNSGLKDDSRILGLSIVQTLSPNVELNLGLNFVHAEQDDYVPENIRMFQFHATTSYIKPILKKMMLNTGVGILVTDYNIRSLNSVNGNQITYTQYGNGTAFGLSPELGVRYAINKKTHLDLLGSYSYYFGSDHKNFGGLGLHSKVSFDF